MKIPNAENAILDIVKLRGYCLNADHPKGKEKARVFMSALGLKQADALWLRAEIVRELPFVAAVRQTEDRWGVRYAVDMEITRHAKSAKVRTIWMIERGDPRPRFITCRVV